MNPFMNPNFFGNNNTPNNNGCCHKDNNEDNMKFGCKLPNCPTIYKECPPIVTCSKQVINQYHITKQPYVHNYHTEVVHHHIIQNEFIPNYTCSEVHVNEPDNTTIPNE